MRTADGKPVATRAIKKVDILKPDNQVIHCVVWQPEDGGYH
ncbi:hypothetical protein [Yersinia similis]|nr:hypothetical protein [Yersinia similis]